jgi:hypothetical protein
MEKEEAGQILLELGKFMLESGDDFNEFIYTKDGKRLLWPFDTTKAVARAIEVLDPNFTSDCLTWEERHKKDIDH